MKISEMFPSRFMKAEDFEEGESRILTIKMVEMEELGQGKDAKSKPVIYFRDHEKQLVLNKTNCSIVAKLHGDDTDDWVGKRIALYAVEVESFGDVVRAIRVKTTMPKPAIPEGAVPAGAGVNTHNLSGGNGNGDARPMPRDKAEAYKQGYEDAKPKSKRALVQTGKWAALLKRALTDGYVPDDSTGSASRLLNVVGAAGIESVNDLNLRECWMAIENHYEAKNEKAREEQAQENARAEVAQERAA